MDEAKYEDYVRSLVNAMYIVYEVFVNAGAPGMEEAGNRIKEIMDFDNSGAPGDDHIVDLYSGDKLFARVDTRTGEMIKEES